MLNFDLNLICVFNALYESNSVTLAADKLGVTQPSVSYSLNRMREYFNDPLFFRDGRTMEPTRIARMLYPGFKEAERGLSVTIEDCHKFDPYSTPKCFRIALCDIGEAIILPKLFHKMRELAPNAELEVRALEPDKMHDWLLEGSVDVAINRGGSNATGIDSCILGQERYVCLLRQDHPRINNELTLDDFLRETHVYITRNLGFDAVDEALEHMGLRRQVALRIPHVLVALDILASSDSITVLPMAAASEIIASRSIGLKALELPVELNGYDVSLYWSERSSRSISMKWFLELILSAL